MATKKKYPKAFYDDGLGDILEWIDDEVLVHSGEKRPSGVSKKNKRQNESGSELDERKSKSDKKKQLNLYGANDLEKVLNKKTKKVKVDEPIDEFEPMREQGSNRTKLDKNLLDRTRGLINRLAAQTMPYVSGEFEKLYSTQSRTDLNIALFSNIERSVLMEASIAKRKLVAELMLLVAYLDFKISHNIGATIVHKLVKQLETLYKGGTCDQDKRLDNIIFCLVNLYIIGLISANVIFELTKRICSPEDFRPKSVELLLIILKNIGFQLRKDNPRLMRQLIVLSHEQCVQLRTNSKLDTRMEFILDALGAIKNNNISKIGNYGCDIDKDTIELTLKSLIKRIKIPESLNDATYCEILSSSNWYLLETRMDEVNNESIKDIATTQEKVKDLVSNKTEAKICKALGLNKPAERTIFGALMKVSDYVEASNIIISYGLNHCSDAMVVIIHVAVHEKKYNSFYFNVINNLCKFNRKYKMAAKFAIQDKIRILSKMPSQRVSVLSRLCLELIQSDAIPITVLKSVEWADLTDSTKQFLTYLLESISALPEDEKRRIMVKSDRKSSFAGAMRTFTNCFLKGCQLFE